MATQPTLAMIPSGYKDGKLYSVLPSDGVGDFDVTRGSNATRINKDGLIETVTGNTPRLDYTGGGCPSLLLEPSRTNSITYSEDFTNWTSSGWTLTSGLLSPNGGLDAYSVLRTTGSTFAQTLTLLSNTTYTFSAYIKNVNATNIQLRVQNQAGNTSGTESNCIVFSVTDQTNSTDFTRITHTFNTGDAGGYGLFLGYYSVGEYIVYGAQLEQGSFPTSYIKSNSGSTTTRLSDTANNAGNASTFNDSEGVLFAEISDLYSGGGGVISINTGNNTQKIFLYLLNNTTVRYYAQGSGGVITDDIPISLASNFNKIVFKYKSSDFAVWINGFELYTNTSAITFSNLSSLDFHNPYLGGTENFYGKTKQLQYFNTALTDLELETLTSFTSFNAMALAQNYTI